MNGEKGILFTQGNEACVRGALYAGLRFFAGYPITPSTEVAELLSEELPHVGGRFIQMEDEISSLCAVCAASVAGDKAMTATSHAIIVLTASSVQDVFAMTVEGFNMAETYRTPVILLFDEVVGHMRERLDMPEPGELPVVERLRTSVKAGVNYYPYLPREDGRLPMSDFGGVHRYNVTGLYHDIWGFPTEQPEAVNKLLYHLVDKIEAKAAEIARWKEYFLDDAQQVFVSYGSAARSALHLVHTLRGKGIRAGLLELQTLWPFPAELVRDRTEGARNVYVVEMNMGHIMAQVRQAAWKPDRVFLVNRVDGQLITPTDIGKVMRVIEGRGF